MSYKKYLSILILSGGAGLCITENSYAQHGKDISLLSETINSPLYSAPVPIPEPLTPLEEKTMWLGVVGGPNFVKYRTSTFPILLSTPNCFTAQNGYGIAPHFGIDLQLPVDSYNHNFVVIEALYDSKSSKFNSNNNTRSGVPTRIDGNIQPGGISTDMAASLFYVLLNLGYKYNLVMAPMPVGPSFQVSANLGIKVLGTFMKTVTVVAGANSSGMQSSTQNSTVFIDGVKTIRFGFRGQFGYDFPVFYSKLFISPFVGYDLPLTQVDNTDRSWTAPSVYAGIGLYYSIGLGYH